jgi:hypothetical protein
VMIALASTRKRIMIMTSFITSFFVWLEEYQLFGDLIAVKVNIQEHLIVGHHDGTILGQV